MTDDCFWTFEGCTEEEDTFSPDGGSGGSTGEKVKIDYDASNFSVNLFKDPALLPVSANLAYLSVATIITAFSYMRIFRWRKDYDNGDSFYKDFETAVGGFNYWQWIYTVLDWGRLGIFGFAWIT